MLAFVAEFHLKSYICDWPNWPDDWILDGFKEKSVK